MSRALDLLTQADALLDLDPRRPRQVNLQRAVSATYYALFHYLIGEAVSSTLGKERTPTARQLHRSMSRWYSHTRMKETANWFRRARRAPEKIEALLGRSSATPRGIVPIELERVATAFANLQEARHRADYDTGARFSRSEAQEFVRVARAALTDWSVVATTAPARLLLLLTGDAPVQSR
ncbi:MAG: hypothetical protein Q8S73_15415 [Deltaproteobacteria bacterium]|nr:hypothetical protein [Myxococcales bacterium]MDP3215495.1 hypothetical protein [Deltaproteobacteria bacterium]